MTRNRQYNKTKDRLKLRVWVHKDRLGAKETGGWTNRQNQSRETREKPDMGQNTIKIKQTATRQQPPNKETETWQ